MHAVNHLIRRLRRAERGNITVIFALSCVPVVSGIGFAVDYARAVQLKAQLLAAANAASVGSIAKTSPAFIAAGSMNSDGPIPAGVTDATNLFNGNISGVTGYTLNSVTPTVVLSDGAVTSKVKFSAHLPTMFLGVMGKSTMTVTGTSTATATIPPAETSSCCSTNPGR